MKNLIFVILFIFNCNKNFKILYKIKEKNSLKEAVRLNDLDKVKTLLDSSSHEEVNNAFLFSIEKNRNEISHFLLKKITDPNAINEKSESPLIIAASNKNLYMMELLLDIGAHVNFRDRKGNTALIIASKGYATYEILELLVNRGANLDLKNNEGLTPLMMASIGYNCLSFPSKGGCEYKNIELLVNRGADLNLKSNDGFTALTFAMFNCYSMAVDFLIDKGAKLDINYEDKYGANLLMYAAKCGKINIIRELIEKGLDVNSIDKSNMSVLLYAVSSKLENLEVVKYLLKKGATPNNLSNKNKFDRCFDRAYLEIKRCSVTALMLASFYNYEDTAKMLIEFGADPNTKDDYGNTALSYAVNYGNFNIVKLLLEKFSDINYKDQGGRTALIYAITEGYIDIVEILIKRGADFRVKDQYGNEAIDYSIDRVYRNITKLLIDFGASPKMDVNHETIIYSIKEGRENIIAELSKAVADIHTICKINAKLFN